MLDNTGVRIISVNSNFWCKVSEAELFDVRVLITAAKFVWMVSELEAAEAARERVWLIGKLPCLIESYPSRPRKWLTESRIYATGCFRCLP